MAKRMRNHTRRAIKAGGLALSVAICVILAGCFSHPEYLEAKYFCQREIGIFETPTNVSISISGLCGHSSLGVARSEKSIHEDVLAIEFPLRVGASGSIHETISVPNYVNKVKLAGELIWERRRAR